MKIEEEEGVDEDVVVKVKDGGKKEEMGFEKERGIKFEYGIIRKNYVGRKLIENKKKIREIGVKMKN